MDNVTPLTPKSPPPLRLIGGAPVTRDRTEFTLVFNRSLTQAEWEFFYETAERTAFLMRTMKP